MEALVEDHREAPVTSAERAMLDYAVKLTRTPWAMREEDVETLRQAGLDDTAILDVCQITGYYNFVNRLADGLGVELEGYWEEEQEPPEG